MRLRRGCSGIWIAMLAAALDRISKAAVMAQADPQLSGGLIFQIPGVVAIRRTHNYGMAFSTFSSGGIWTAIATALIVAGLAAWLLLRPDACSKGVRAGLWMIVGGGLGNLYDRIAYGYVIDFIDLQFVRFAVFNLADVAICLGAVIAAVSYILAERKNAASRTKT